MVPDFKSDFCKETLVYPSVFYSLYSLYCFRLRKMFDFLLNFILTLKLFVSSVLRYAEYFRKKNEDSQSDTRPARLSRNHMEHSVLYLVFPSETHTFSYLLPLFQEPFRFPFSPILVHD